MYTKFAKFARLYFPYFGTFQNQTLQFTTFRTLFNDLVIFLPVSNSFKISSKRLKVHRETLDTLNFTDTCGSTVSAIRRLTV